MTWKVLDLIFWGRQLFIQESKPVTWALSHLIVWNFAILIISKWDLPSPASSLARVVRGVNDCLICWDFLLCFCLFFLVYLFSVFPTKAYVPRLRLRLKTPDGWKFIFAVKPANDRSPTFAMKRLVICLFAYLWSVFFCFVLFFFCV